MQSLASHDVRVGRLKTTILTVEDNADVRESLASLFHNEGYAICLAAEGIYTLTTLADDRPDFMLSDLKMPRLAGQELLRLVRQFYPEIRTVAMSGEFSPRMAPQYRCRRFLRPGQRSGFASAPNLVRPRLPIAVFIVKTSLTSSSNIT